VGQLEHLDWRTSSYSGGNGGACMEVAAHDGMILVRDTKDHGRGPVSRYTPRQWRLFITGIRDGKSRLEQARRLR
jgi:hypothetical protein